VSTKTRGQKNFALGSLKEVFEQWCRQHGYDERLTFLAAWYAFSEMDPGERVRYFTELGTWTDELLAGGGDDDDGDGAGGPDEGTGRLKIAILPDGTIASANRRFMSLVGRKSAQVLGKPLWTLAQSRRARTAIMRAIEGLEEKGDEAEIATRLRSASGETIQVDWTIRGYFDPEGDLTFCQAEGAMVDGS
jgi:PAS domain S-box-containing protein